MHESHKRKTEEMIADTIRALLHSGKVVRIETRRGKFMDGDEVLRVKVIFDNKKKTLDAREMSSITRAVRKSMLDLNDAALPYFSSIAKSELGKRTAA